LEVSQSISRNAAGVRAATAADRRGSILRYKADRGPVAFVVTVFILRLAVWALATPLFCVFSVLPLVFLGMFIAPINHHQHVNSFRASWLNRIYDLALALQSGIGPYGWVLHHNLGHHLNYLNQPPHENADESHWTRKNGEQMGRVEYSFHLFFHHQFDIFRVGLRHPKYLRYFLLMKLPLWGLIGIGLWLNPLATVLIFLLPGVLTLLHSAWATYEHHSGLPLDGHHNASRNRTSPLYNALTGNLGLHTAHHKRPGLHWSLLPELHAEIEGEIPDELILTKFW